MTVADQHVSPAAWNEPDGLNPRGTLIVIPGRGELPDLYERFGRRLAADAYRVRVVADPVADPGAARAQVAAALADDGSPAPRVLVGSDTGALLAVILAGPGGLPGADALILAGLPAAEPAGAASGPPADAAAPAGPGQSGEADPAWDAELDTRTFCPTHRARLSASGLRRGALFEPVPDWAQQADLAAVTVPVLGLHGSDDPVSPLAAARARYAAAPHAELVSIAGGRHDALNDLDHRTAAATVVLFLERLRRDPGAAPVAVPQDLTRD
jgi:alpha-beta hydrolase superfamily lysophospholipase